MAVWRHGCLQLHLLLESIVALAAHCSALLLAVHAAFMGAAISMLADPVWVEILWREDPATYALAER